MQNITLTIQKLQISDWKIYKQIQLEALKNNQESFATPLEKMMQYSDEKWQERFHENSMIFVALDQDKAVGLTGLYRSSKYTIPDLWGMYVNDDYRRIGLGQRLINEALSLAKHEWGVRKIGLMVNEDQIPSVEFYKKLGFQKIGSQNYLLGDGKKHQVLVMEKEI